MASMEILVQDIGDLTDVPIIEIVARKSSKPRTVFFGRTIRFPAEPFLVRRSNQSLYCAGANPGWLVVYNSPSDWGGVIGFGVL